MISSSYTPPSSSAGTTYYYCVVSDAQGGCDAATTNTATQTIDADPSISSQPSSGIDVCEGGSPSAMSVTATGGSTSYTYQWYSNGSNSNSGGTSIPSATSSSYTPPSSSAGTTYYYCVVSDAQGGCDAATTNTATQTIDADPSISSQPSSGSDVCEGGSPSAMSVTATGGSTSYTYQWYSNGSNSNSGGTSIPSATSSSYTPPSISAGTTYYYCVVSDAQGGCDAATTNTASQIVDAAVTVSAAGNDISQCNNGSFTMAANSPSSGTGAWSVFSGSATITTSSSNTSAVTGVSTGSNATLRWTITNGACSSIDDVVITNNTLPTVDEVLQHVLLEV